MKPNTIASGAKASFFQLLTTAKKLLLFPPYILNQTWYWRTFPTEYLSLRFMRNKYGHLYNDCQRMPLVSIIIPTLNRGQLIVERTLPSIFNQTYQNFEVVIVGDHATEDTVYWISQVKDRRVRFYNLGKHNKYPKDPTKCWKVAGTEPVNKARELARGEWIAPIDDDDIFTPDHIEWLLNFAQEGDYEWAAGAFLEERTPGILTSCIDIKKNWSMTTRTATSCWLYRSYLKYFISDVHSWRYDLNGDQSLKKRYQRSGVRMGYTEHFVTHKLLSPGSNTLYTVLSLENQKN